MRFKIVIFLFAICLLFSCNSYASASEISIFGNPIVRDNNALNYSYRPINLDYFKEKQKKYYNQIIKYTDIIDKYAKKYDVDPNLMICLIIKESSFNPLDSKDPSKLKISPAGALGLSQIMPSNAKLSLLQQKDKDYLEKSGIITNESLLAKIQDKDDQEVNIMLGIAFFAKQLNSIKAYDKDFNNYRGNNQIPDRFYDHIKFTLASYNFNIRSINLEITNFHRNIDNKKIEDIYYWHKLDGQYSKNKKAIDFTNLKYIDAYTWDNIFYIMPKESVEYVEFIYPMWMKTFSGGNIDTVDNDLEFMILNPKDDDEYPMKDMDIVWSDIKYQNYIISVEDISVDITPTIKLTEKVNGTSYNIKSKYFDMGRTYKVTLKTFDNKYQDSIVFRIEGSQPSIEGVTNKEITVVNGNSIPLNGIINSQYNIEAITANIKGVKAGYKHAYKSGTSFDLSKFQINTDELDFSEETTYNIDIWVRTEKYESPTTPLYTFILKVLPNNNMPSINLKSKTINLNIGDNLKLEGTINVKDPNIDYFTKITLIIDNNEIPYNGNFSNGLDKTVKEYDLSKFALNTKEVPLSNVGTHSIRIWAKTSLYPRPLQPLAEIKIYIGNKSDNKNILSEELTDKELTTQYKKITYSNKDIINKDFIFTHVQTEALNKVKKYLTSENALVSASKTNGEPILMFFEGAGSDDYGNGKYGAMAIVLKNSDEGDYKLEGIFLSASTLPFEKNGNIHTIKDGIYPFISGTHFTSGGYPALHLNSNKKVPSIKFNKKEKKYVEEDARGIHIHAAFNRNSEEKPDSIGCINISWYSDNYYKFCNLIGIMPGESEKYYNAKGRPIKTFIQEGDKLKDKKNGPVIVSNPIKGIVIVDRVIAKENLENKKLLKGENKYTKFEEGYFDSLTNTIKQ